MLKKEKKSSPTHSLFPTPLHLRPPCQPQICANWQRFSSRTRVLRAVSAQRLFRRQAPAPTVTLLRKRMLCVCWWVGALARSLALWELGSSSTLCLLSCASPAFLCHFLRVYAQSTLHLAGLSLPPSARSSPRETGWLVEASAGVPATPVSGRAPAGPPAHCPRAPQAVPELRPSASVFVLLY